MVTYHVLSFVSGNVLANKYVNASEQEKLKLQTDFGKANLEKIAAEIETERFIQAECKRCPHCSAAIQVIVSVQV